MTDHDLDHLFDAMRADAPHPPASLTARVVADAQAQMQPRVAPAVRKARRRAVWAGLARMFGGGGALAGMATAALAGFYIGFADPAQAGLMSSVLGQAAELDMMPGIDALLDEAP